MKARLQRADGLLRVRGRLECDEAQSCAGGFYELPACNAEEIRGRLVEFESFEFEEFFGHGVTPCLQGS